MNEEELVKKYTRIVDIITGKYRGNYLYADLRQECLWEVVRAIRTYDENRATGTMENWVYFLVKEYIPKFFERELNGIRVNKVDGEIIPNVSTEEEEDLTELRSPNNAYSLVILKAWIDYALECLYKKRRFTEKSKVIYRDYLDNVERTGQSGILQHLADKYGVSRKRVFQIVDEHNKYLREEYVKCGV